MIKYACVVFFRCDNKYKVAVGNIRANKKESSQNVAPLIKVSSWVHPDLMSKECTAFINNINKALQFDNTKSIFSNIYSTVHEYPQDGLSRAKAYKYIEDNISCTITNKRKVEILRYCTPYRCSYYSSNNRNNYKKKDKNTSGTIKYDFEDLYYCFMMDDEIKKYEHIFSNIRQLGCFSQEADFEFYGIFDNQTKKAIRRINKMLSYHF